MRRLDLEAGTNADGKMKFAGLPARVQRPPLEFQASKDEFRGVVAFDPSTGGDVVARSPVFLTGDGVEVSFNDLLAPRKSVASAHERNYGRCLWVLNTGLPPLSRHQSLIEVSQVFKSHPGLQPLVVFCDVDFRSIL
jgi:hypothetical protein